MRAAKRPNTAATAINSAHTTSFTVIAGRGSAFYTLLGGLAALIAAGLWAAHTMDAQGHHITGMNNQIVWGTTVGRAVTDTHMTMALSYGATLWQQLLAMKIPGLKAVYCPPEGSGRFLAIISMKQMYPGHADQVLTAAISTEMGAYGLKTVIVVDEDIDPWDIPRVLYALSFRFQPNRSQVIKRGRSTPLDPSLPINAREITGRLLLDATIPYDWKDKPIPIELDPKIVEKVKGRWSELGL